MQSIATIDLLASSIRVCFVFLFLFLTLDGVSWHDPMNGSANCSNLCTKKN